MGEFLKISSAVVPALPTTIPLSPSIKIPLSPFSAVMVSKTILFSSPLLASFKEREKVVNLRPDGKTIANLKGTAMSLGL